MKLSELKEIVDQLVSHYPDHDVVIDTQGLSGSCVSVTSLSIGFDWYAGKIMVFPKHPLSTVNINKYALVKELYLNKISNYKKVDSGITLIAKYKTKEFTGKTKWESLSWLREQLNLEIDKNHD